MCEEESNFRKNLGVYALEYADAFLLVLYDIVFSNVSVAEVNLAVPRLGCSLVAGHSGNYPFFFIDLGPQDGEGDQIPASFAGEQNMSPHFPTTLLSSSCAPVHQTPNPNETNCSWRTDRPDTSSTSSSRPFFSR